MNDQQASCPLDQVDRRLSDVHRLWHEAEQAYFDPDAFRAAIQGAIQTLRTVTWLLQAQKQRFPDFDGWYGPWQDKLRLDPLMAWMVDARNRIEKRGDLEALSLVRAEIVASHLDEGPRLEIPAALFDAPWKLIKSIPDGELGDHIRKDGILRIERRWVENTLPDWELLDAVAVAYGQISRLVADAHIALGLEEPEVENVEFGRRVPRPSDGRLPCMIGHGERRAEKFSLSDGRPLTIVEQAHPIKTENRPEVEAHYGVQAEDIFPSKGNGGAEGIARDLVEASKVVFLKDGYHEHAVFLLRDGRMLEIAQMRIAEPGQKYLMSRKLAELVRKADATEVILIDEIWTAKFDPAHPYRRAADVPERGEALAVTFAAKGGKLLRWTTEIIREGNDVRLGHTIESKGGAFFHLAPVLMAWGEDVPDEWLAPFEATEKE